MTDEEKDVLAEALANKEFITSLVEVMVPTACSYSELGKRLLKVQEDSIESRFDILDL
jgi:hypothetical protein